MESTEAGSIDDSLDSKNLEASMEDIGVAKYEDCNSEVLTSQTDDDQGGEQVYGYLEVRNPGSEDATIILDSEGFNLSGQRLILTQNDDGNGIIVVVSEDPDGQNLEQTFAHASVLHSDGVSFEDGLKEHTLVMDEQSQGLEFIETEEVPQEHEERHVYIENSGGIINISNENQCSPINAMNIESPLWSVSNNTQLKNDSTEMLFIPNPTVVLAPEENKHRKLMQLACIAHELQSADQKSSSTPVNESTKETETSLSEFETSVIVTQSDVVKDSNRVLLETNNEIQNSESAECLPSIDSKNDQLDSSPKSISKSVDVSSLLQCTSSRAVDNAVSVIHTTSSELQENSLENQTKDNSSDFSSVKNYHSSESELPSEMLYSSRISRVSFHDSLDEEPSNTKQLEENTGEDLEESSHMSIEDSSESKNIRSSVINRELGLDCSPRDDDSPITFIEKTQKLDCVDPLGIEDNPLGETEADLRVDEEDSHAGSCIVVVEDDESKEVEEDCNPSVVTNDNFSESESPLLKDNDTNQRTSLQQSKVPADVDSELSTSDNDNTDNHERSSSTSKSDLTFLNSKYLFKYKSRSKKTYLSKNASLSPVLHDEEIIDPKSQYDFDESDINDSNKIEEDNKCEPMDFEDSPADNLDSDLVIAESAEDEECNSNANVPESECNSTKNEIENLPFEETVENKSPQSAENIESEKSVSEEIGCENSKMNLEMEVGCENSKMNLEMEVPSDEMPVCKESEKESNSMETSDVKLDATVADDDFSYNEETLVKTPMKTYIRKKVKKNVVESKSSIKENIELFSVDDLNFSECDKDINDVENSLNSDQLRESASLSQESNMESDDHLLLSGIQSKVSATYNRKKKTLPVVKHGTRTRNLRPRSLSSKLPLENGTQEISDTELKKNSFDSSSSENIPWGDVLMSTSFQPRVESNSDKPSTSSAPKSPLKSSTPALSPEQQKRKLNKYTRAFDKLLNSSPVRSKKLKTNAKSFIPKGRKKFFKARQKSMLSSSSYSDYLGNSDSSYCYNARASSSKESKGRSRALKKANIQYLNQNAGSETQSLKQQVEEEIFSCSTCNFVSKKVNNLIEHLKYCKSVQPVLSYRVNDMDKRQRIRGDDSVEKSEEVSGSCNGAVRSTERKNLSQGEFSGGCHSQDADEVLDLDFISDNKRKKKTQYGYGEDDVVWVKYKDRFWPALVCEIRGSKAHVRLINHPDTDKGLKVKHENIRTFDDAKWNCLCLKEAVNLPNNAVFVKSVASAETFMRRKFLGSKLKGKYFFNLQEAVDFATDTASSDSIVDDSDDDDADVAIRFPPPARKFRYDKLDKERILSYIIEGSVDEYVLDIYNEKVHSDKHFKFFDVMENDDLDHKPWFGPFEEKSEIEELFLHFKNLFCAKVGDSLKDPKFTVAAYLTQVWIPEAIVKAISIVNAISQEEAENLFESEDSFDMECDPEPDEIHEVYS